MVQGIKQDLLQKVTQSYGVDYFKIFSAVAKQTSNRVILSLATNFYWPLYQLDVKNAFLHGDLKEEVYMNSPPGFVVRGHDENVFLSLKNSLYGLKQSPRPWFVRFSRAVLKCGFQRCNADHTVFFLKGGI